MEGSVDLTMQKKGWPLDGNVKPGMWRGRSPRSALISHLYLLSNPLWQPSIARDPVWEAPLLTQGYISITEGSESDEQLICLINPSFSKKNIWSWGADLLSCSYWRINGFASSHGYAGRLHIKKAQFKCILAGVRIQHTDRTVTIHICLIVQLEDTRIPETRVCFSLEETRRMKRSPNAPIASEKARRKYEYWIMSAQPEGELISEIIILWI